MAHKLPILLVLSVAALATTPVGAQVLSAPQDVVHCLCADRTMTMLNEELAARKRIYDDTSQQLNALDLDLERRRQTMNVEDPAQVDAYRAQFDRRDQLRALLTGSVGADYQNAVERYNRAVAVYNSDCSGRVLDSGVVAAVTPTLACPVP
jgi:hypothetical protein